MLQLQQFTTEDKQTAYQSETTANRADSRSEVSRTDVMTEEERRAINKPGRAAFGDPLLGEIPASARHVRPEELAVALAAIEARKGEALVETQPLGMALLKTNSPISADEVWEEIQKQREQQVKTSPTRSKKGRKPPIWLKIGIGLACVGATAVAVRVLMSDILIVNANSPGPQTFQNPGATQPNLRTRKPADYAYEKIFVKQPGTIPLAQLPQGKSFHLDPQQARELDRILNGDANTLPVPPEELKNYYFTPDTDQGTRWNSAILNNKVYVRGWISPPPGTTIADLAKSSLRIYNRPDHPDLLPQLARQISLPVDAFSGMGTSSSGAFGSLDATGPKLDSVDWGPWESIPLPPSDPTIYQRQRRNTFSVQLGFGKSIQLDARPRTFTTGRAIRIQRGPSTEVRVSSGR